MHNAAFAAIGIDMVYVALPVSAARLGDAVAGLAALGFRGANVTIPHKGAVLAFLDDVDEEARLVAAVNTIVVDAGRPRGYNTDVAGVARALGDACPDGLDGDDGLVLGAGGAARAAALALARMGVRLTIVNRTAAAAGRLAALIAAAVPGTAPRVVSLPDLTAAAVGGSRLVVNATSLGMWGAGKVPSVLADNVSAGQVVFDVVYTRGRTDLLARAEAHGATVVDGREMLVHQAAAAFRLWTGRPAPLDVMRDAIEGR